MASITLIPVFTGMLGSSLFWPKKTRPQLTDHKLWFHLARFGLWQPWIAIIVVLYFAGAFAFGGNHQQLAYSNAQDIPNNQAVQGARILSAHFGQGKSTPVTLYIQNNQRLDNQDQLYQLDNLTKKLRAQPGVAAVTSVTQPGGQPVTQYYVANQLDGLNTSLSGAINQLTTVRNDLKTDQSDLKQKTLNAEVKRLNKLTTKTNKLMSNSSTLESAIQSAQSTATTSGTASKKARQYVKRLNQVNSELNDALSTLNTLSSNISTTSGDTSTAYSNLSSYKENIKTVNASLKRSQKQVKQLSKSLNQMYTYLGELQTSEAAKSLYLTPTQLASGEFQQALVNFTDKQVKATTLTITLKQEPNAKTTAKTLADLKQVATSQLRGTSLKNAKLTFSGQPVVTATIQRQYQHDIVRVLLLVFGITLVLLIVFSRSVLQPIYWFLTFLASAAASYQLTRVIMQWLNGSGEFNWQVPMLAFVPVTVLAVVELTQLALSYRLNDAPLIDWLLPGIKDAGQTMRHSLFIIIAGALGLLAASSQVLSAVTLITVLTAVIFNLALPMMAASFGKLSVIIPAQKPFHFTGRRRKSRRQTRRNRRSHKRSKSSDDDHDSSTD